MFGVLKLGDLEIAPESMAAPLVFYKQVPQTWNIFCMYALNSMGFEHGVSAETVKDFKTAVQLHERCYGLGSHVVVLRDMPQFLDRVNELGGRISRDFLVPAKA